MPTEPFHLPENMRELDVDGLEDWVDGYAVRLLDARRELARRVVAAGEEDAEVLIEVAGWVALCQADIRTMKAKMAALVVALEREEARNSARPPG